MRKWVVLVLTLLLAAGAAQAQDQAKETKGGSASALDTVKVMVFPAGSNQLRLDIFVVNSAPVAGMPVPMKVWSKEAKVAFDSVSYQGGRVEYFQLKAENADTANHTVLLGLIADLSGTKPPLEPGRGKAFSLYFTTDKAFKAADVVVEPIVIPPANKLEFNVYRGEQLDSIIPTFVVEVGKAEQAKPAAGTDK